MGRGLSKLQKFVLDKAKERKRVFDNCEMHDVCDGAGCQREEDYVNCLKGMYFIDEICHDYFGWEYTIKMKRGFGGWHFSKKDIDAKEYNKVRVTISRVINSLLKRGLIEIFEGKYRVWVGIRSKE